MANKLLLLEDVEALGRSGDIVSVRPGFARNYLLPQGYAVIATKSALRMQAKLQEERKKRAIIDRQESEKAAGILENVNLETTVKVDQEGHMYGSVTAADIVELLEKQANITLEKRAIQIKHAIKELGEHKINVKLKEGVVSSFNLTIMPEGGIALAPKEAKESKPSKEAE
jgi:large subunit ribosomal protein L9